MRALVAVLAVAGAAHAAEQRKPLCIDNGEREQIRAIMLDGVDQALKQHTVHVFGTWLKDKTHQPERAIAGMRIGIEAYIRSKRAIIDWNLPPCPEK